MPEVDSDYRLLTVGASAGGLKAVSQLLAQMDHEMNIAVCIVLHITPESIGNYLVQHLQSATSLQCKKVVSEEKIERGNVYIAPPGQHLLVTDHDVKLGSGPTENRWKPSIDVLFRSAAISFTSRTIGIILTGLLDDGTAGMIAIKECGGKVLVQDPDEAEYPDMPTSVLNSLEVDYCIPVSKMGDTVRKIIREPYNRDVRIPEDVKREATIALNVATGISNLETLGERTVFSCPDCGGALYAVQGEKINRYRCYVGHAYSERDLILKQAEGLNATLWVAMRMLVERYNLLKKLEHQNEKRGFTKTSSEHHRRAAEIEHHIRKLKELLFSITGGQAAGGD